MLSEPSPYYLLLFLSFALLKKHVFYPLGLMVPKSISARIYEAIVAISFVAYASYLIAYEYFDLRF